MDTLKYLFIMQEGSETVPVITGWLISVQEHGETVSAYYRSDYFTEGFRRFMYFYKPWLVSSELEPQVHPWVKFVQPTPVVPTEDEDQLVTSMNNPSSHDH